MLQLERIVKICLLVALLSWQEAEAIKFLVYGDWGSQSQAEYAPTQIAVANQMEKSADVHKPAFVISVGDNFYESGVSSTDDPKWTNDFTNIYKKQGSLNVRFYQILGNHCYQGNVQAQLDFKADERWYMPGKNYTWTVDIGDADHTQATFVALDTTPFIQYYYEQPRTPDMQRQLALENWENQLKWFGETLAAITTPWVIVIGHHPMYSSNQWNLHGGSPELRTHLQPLLELNRVVVYFAGHEHDLQYLVSGPSTQTGGRNLHHIISGAAGRIVIKPQKRQTSIDADQVFHSDQAGFVLVDLQPNSMHCTFINHKGENLHEMAIAPSGATVPSTSDTGMALSSIIAIVAAVFVFAGAVLGGVLAFIQRRKRQAEALNPNNPLLDNSSFVDDDLE